MKLKPPQDANSWQLQHAKARLSELLRCAEIYPQTITLHGRTRAIVITFRMFKAMLADIRQLREKVAALEQKNNSQTSQDLNVESL